MIAKNTLLQNVYIQTCHFQKKSLWDGPSVPVLIFSPPPLRPLGGATEAKIPRFKPGFLAQGFQKSSNFSSNLKIIKKKIKILKNFKFLK